MPESTTASDQDRVAELNTKINDLISQITTLNANYEAMKTELTSLRADYEALRTKQTFKFTHFDWFFGFLRNDLSFSPLEKREIAALVTHHLQKKYDNLLDINPEEFMIISDGSKMYVARNGEILVTGRPGGERSPMHGLRSELKGLVFGHMNGVGRH